MSGQLAVFRRNFYRLHRCCVRCQSRRPTARSCPPPSLVGKKADRWFVRWGSAASERGCPGTETRGGRRRSGDKKFLLQFSSLGTRGPGTGRERLSFHGQLCEIGPELGNFRRSAVKMKTPGDTGKLGSPAPTGSCF